MGCAECFTDVNCICMYRLYVHNIVTSVWFMWFEFGRCEELLCFLQNNIPIQPIIVVGFENIVSMWFKREQITTQSHTFSECFISTRWQFRLEQYNIAKQCLINVTKYLYGVTKPSYGLISKTKMNRKRNNHKRTIQKNQTRILANN